MKLSDTLTGEKRDFSPAGDEVKMYVCGVTPYASAHVGHAMSYVVFDVLHRYLEYRGYRVRRVQNFTDIDDKLIDRANQEGTTVTDLAERLIDEYFADMAALNVRNADVYPRATQELPTIIEMIEGLIAKQFAYSADGDVYFRVTRDPGYGKLSHRSLDGMRAGARVEESAAKEHPMDFALWKAAKPGEPAWDSPWGPGRPGWHIECSAMSLRYLGETIDIHGGGQDLVFPHHENEIAQSEAFTGARPFVRHWLHNGLLLLGDEKMSKSVGNLRHDPGRALPLLGGRHPPERAELALPRPWLLLRRGDGELRARRGPHPPSGEPRKQRGQRRAAGPVAVRGAVYRRHGRRPQHAPGARRALRPDPGREP